MKQFNLKKSSLVAFVMMLAMLLAVSCDTAQEEDNSSATDSFVNVPAKLIGTWEITSPYTESYTITSNTFTNGYYAGDNVKVFKTSETSGYIYMQYTKANDGDWTSYSESAPDVGKWYAISYKELTDSSVKLAGAFKADGKTSTATIDKAKAEFTIENGYFAFAYSELPKKN